MSTTSPSRRERLRTATLVEVKDLARRLLVTGGPSAISLRAIARDMGMTAPALYRYFPSLDALIMELTEDLYDELRDVVEAARDGAGEPLGQLVEMARTFRRWSIAHPAEFGLMFGNPVPGVTRFEEGCFHPDHAGARFGAAFLAALAELWREEPFATPPVELLTARLAASLQGHPSPPGPEVPIQVMYVYLSAWTRLYGLVAMEVFGHLRWASMDVEPLFEVELTMFAAQLSPAQPNPPPPNPAPPNPAPPNPAPPNPAPPNPAPPNPTQSGPPQSGPTPSSPAELSRT